MAKQYIPGVSGLLTEPNPVDSPSNTLSEAENVVIEQQGKVQARHGLNIKNADSNISVPSIVDYPTQSTVSITGTIDISLGITFTSLNRTLIIVTSDTNNIAITFTLGYRTADQIISQIGAGASLTADNKIKLSYSQYIEIGNGTANDVLGFIAGDYKNYNRAANTRSNSILQASYKNNGDSFFKFIQFKNTNDDILSGYFVKQTANQYNSRISTTTGYRVDYSKSDGIRDVYRYYQIDKNSGKLLNFNELSYTSVKSIVQTDKSLYLQTENGLAECNLDTLFNPSARRFFTIKWPPFPELLTTLTQSDLYANWFTAGYKCGIRYTFYRELGYTDLEDDIYESEPSKTYEVTNNGKDSIINVDFDFNSKIDGSLLFEKFNEFSKLNNGRKFGIILYRTKIVQNDQTIPAEYFQCSSLIPFDTALTFQISSNEILQDNTPFDVYSRVSRVKQLNVNDIISYIPNNKTIDNNSVYGGYVYSANRVQFNSLAVDVNDLLPAKLKVTAKTKVVPTYTGSFFDAHIDVASHTNSHSFPNNSSAKSYFGFTYKNVELSSKFLNVIETRINFTAPLIPTANSEIGVEVWEYEFSGTTPRLINRLSSGRNPITASITPSPATIKVNLDQLIELKSNTSYLIAFYTKSLSTVSIAPSESQSTAVNASTAYNVDYFSWVENGNVQYLGTLTPRGTTDIRLRTFYLQLLRTEDLYVYDYTAVNNITDSLPLTPTILNSGSVLTGGANSSTPTGVEHEGTGIFETWLGTHAFFDNLGIGFSKYPNASYPVEINGTTTYYARRTILSNITGSTITLANHGLQTNNLIEIGPNSRGIPPNTYAITRTGANTFTISASATSTGDLWVNTRIGAYDPTRFQIATTKNGVPFSVTYTTNTYNVTASYAGILTIITSINHQLAVNDYIIIPQTPESILRGITAGRYQIYFVISADQYYIRTACTGSGILPISSLNINVRDNNNSLFSNRYFIKNINVALETNDESLNEIGTQLYTNINAEGSENTNLLAPESEFITNYKDFYVHAGIQKPLTGKFSVIKQPTAESVNLSHYLSSNLTANTTHLLKQNEFVCNGTISALVTQYYNRSTPIFVESSIFNKKPVQLNGVANGSPYTTIQTLNYPNTSNLKPSDTITLSVNSTAVVTTDVMKNFQFGATLFERPSLTLKLVSTDNKTDYVSIQTTPFYNRNGFYPLTAKNDILDDNYLQFPNTINESNSFKTINATVIRDEFVPKMLEGTKIGQCESDGKHKFTTSTTMILSSGQAIYFNNATNKLVITNFNKFDANRFSSPGILLIQTTDASGYFLSHVLVSYSSITAEVNYPGRFNFDNPNFTYVETSGQILQPPSIGNVTGVIYNLWFIQATDEKNIPLYLYSKPDLRSASLMYSTVVNYKVTEQYYDNDASIPLFTFKPHRNSDSTPIAVFEPTGNFLFRGLTQKDASEFLDIYAWSIINEFNAEFNNKGISAYLRKGEGIGEVEVIYPDGKIIELINGEYNLSLGLSSKSGFHQFSPEINNQSFTKLAVRNNNELTANNEIRISRRGIPEITTAQSYNIVGKADKKVIGAAANVDDLYIFKEDGIFRIIDQGNVNGLSNIPIVSVTQISTTSYCQASGSIKEINNEIIYLDQSGFMTIRGGEIANISGAIQKDIRTLISTSPKYRIKAFVNESKNLYYCTLINEVDSTLSVKSGTYIFNTLTRQWSFMNEEIIDGIEDFEKRNLVAYKQKSILAQYSVVSPPLPPAIGTVFESNNNLYYTYQRNNFEFSYPLQIVNNYNNFYSISRESHTNSLYASSTDQYDFITERVFLGTNAVLTRSSNSFRLELSKNQSQYILTEIYSPLHNELTAVVRGVNLSPVDYAYTDAVVFDNVIQHFYNRKVYVAFYNGTVKIGQYPIKLTRIGYDNQNSYLDNEILYNFEFIEDVPANFTSGLVIDSFQLVTGIPVKITFNPESGNSPDTNKLFQEYMVHTETVNKGMAMNFKIDGKVSFLATDRQFVYDATATARNVFRTYVPTAVARGRYLIRRVKHDVPLENLIITGQTMVMRDSSSTRVQKDKDNS